MRTDHPPVRDSDPFTSWAAAYRNQSEDTRLKSVIWSALSQFGPMTHDQLIECVSHIRPASPSGVRTRTAELVELGLVEQVPGIVSRSALGRVALLWRATCMEQPELPYE